MTSEMTVIDTPDEQGRAAIERGEVVRGRLRRTAFVLAAGAGALMWLDGHFGWLNARPGGTTFFVYVRPAGCVVLLVGALLAIGWEIGGGVVTVFGAGAVGAMAVHQLVGWHAAVVILLLAMPGAIWIVVDLLGRSRQVALVGLTGALVAAGVGAGVGEHVYAGRFGPTHPSSDTPAPAESAVRWVWSGGVTSTTAEVRARLRAPAVARLAVSTDADFTDATFREPVAVDSEILAFALHDLREGVEYHYAVEVDGELDRVRSGSFTTFPAGPASFSFTVGSCARVGSNGSVFDAIRAEDQLFHLISGDFHYGDIRDDDRERYDEVIDLTLRQPAQAELYRSVPIAYVWDDHDYGANKADASSPSRLAAMQAYRANVPSYPLAGATSAIYQSFDVGRVRFLITDARSARRPGTMLGARQLAWFVDELVVAAEEQALVVWVNPVPWVAEADDGADDWGGRSDERRMIADVIADHGIDNLLMVSGDAHMVAIDDGTNTDYSTDGAAGFPLLHAGALDRPGSVKGGPYSEGEIAGGGQYGRVDIDDDGETIRVGLVAKRYDGAVLLSYDFVVPGH